MRNETIGELLDCKTVAISDFIGFESLFDISCANAGSENTAITKIKAKIIEENLTADKRG
jgi:hypothetical protein